MGPTKPRGGIERKILTSILWVGILPMALALLAGYLTARGGQSNSVQQALATDARRTAAGVELAAESFLRPVERLAHDPELIKVMRSGAPNLETGARETLQGWLAAIATSKPPHRSMFAILAPDGSTILTSDPAVSTVNVPQKRWANRSRQAEYLDIDYNPQTKRLTAFVAAPIDDPGSGRVLGYLGELLDIGPLIQFALGAPSEPRVESDDFYEVVFLGPDNTYRTVHLGEGSTTSRPILEYGEVDDALAARLRREDAPLMQNTRIPEYQSRQVSRDVYLAYHNILGRNDLYLVVYRPTSAVFSSINLWALLAVGSSVLFIFFLCVNAYRKVHTNIIQPVSLLNEGAQIIRRGDLDLKLKIQTGDEIEELATSFNQMALALSKNIGQLEESEEKYRSLFTSMRDGIYQTNPAGIIILLNRAGVEILGFSHVDDAIGKNLRDLFVNPADYDRLSQEFEDKGFVDRTRVWLKRQDGRMICVEVSGNRVYDDQGATMEVEGIFRDVTTSVRLEQEARERSERISAINQIANVINSSLEAGRLYESLVVEVKKLVNFDYAALALLDGQNNAFRTRQLWPEKASAVTVQSLDVEESCGAWVARERQCLLVDDLHVDGSPFAGHFPANIRSCLCVPLYATGRIIGTLNLGLRVPQGFTVHDVEVLEQMAPHVAVAIRNAQLLENLQLSLEEVTRAREKLHEVNEELKTLDEMKTNLLSNVSHELRTPLVSVMGYTDMIYNGKVGPVNPVQQEYLGISLRNVEKLVTLIENLLDFSRLNRGAEKLVFDTFDLVECAQASLQIIQPVADGREIRLVLNAPDTPVLIEGDKGKLGQVFNNLLSNAVKFNDHGGSVTIEIRPSESSVEVRVIDTGIGIPQEAWDKVFTRFYQYDSSSTRKYGGTGIGLSIAQDIVRLHGSRIHVTSEIGKGSTFMFNLPLVSVRKDGAPDVTLPLPRETHLLIELLSQDRALTVQLRNLLISEGMEVIHATAPANAILLAEKHRPDCLLVDAEENGGGHAALDELFASPTVANLPVVILTNDEDLFSLYREKGASRVKRSFRKSTLLSGIHYALSKGVDSGAPLGKKILCVDDDPEVLTFMQRCLMNEGYTVETCNSGDEALRILATREFSLVMLDIAMPGLDGWETCRRIKSEDALAGIQVYLVTAKPIDGDTPRVHEAGADGYILKPFRPEDLIELVEGSEINQSFKKV